MADVGGLLDRLIEKHLGSLRAIVAAIRGLDVAIGHGGGEGREAAKKAFSLAHQIAGAAGSIGFAEVSLAGRALEQELRPLAEADSGANPQQLASIHALIDRLEAVVLAQRPETSSLYGRQSDALQAAARRREA